MIALRTVFARNDPWFAPFSVVNQYYEAQVYDVFVIKGNAAVFKCQIPSFVSDHVEIVAWQDTDGAKYSPQAHYGTRVFRILSSPSLPATDPELIRFVVQLLSRRTL